uniref:SHSP domain-containing protein n=1 Tax=Salix viminalis TaxID=40686 RepID=A0A6N2LI21_SALVM
MAMIPSFFNNRSRDIIFDPLFSFDPFKDFPFPSSPLVPRENSAFINTRIDWKETPEAHVFKADLPGIKKEEVKVEIEDDRVLQIRGERSVEKEDKNDTWHRVERSSGKFLRRRQKHFIAQSQTRFPLRRHKEEQRREDGNDSKLLQQPITRYHLRPTLFFRSIQRFPFPFIFLVLARIQLSSTLASTGKRPQKPMSSKLIFRGLKRRRFKLPENAKIDQIKAGMENGVLTVTVPKEEVKKADAKKTVEISVEIEDDRVLQIRGERSVEKEDKNDTWHRVERSSGKFLRRFKLPENAKIDQIKAGMENGVLTVTVPRRKSRKLMPRRLLKYPVKKGNIMFDHLDLDICVSFLNIYVSR